MFLTDEDQDQLEDFVDGALAPDEMAMMRARLVRETQLAEALEGVLGERALRRQLFAALEPTEDEGRRFATRVIAGIPKRSRFVRPLKIAAGLAACVAIGFFSGWRAGANRMAVVPIKPAVEIAAMSAESRSAGYQVALTDDAGHVTAVQHFDSLEKAREFSQDLGQWQERQKQLQEGAAIVVADRF